MISLRNQPGLAIALVLIGVACAPRPAAAEVIKRCANCGHFVPPGSHPGLTCPYCGMFWTDENWSTYDAHRFDREAAWAMFQFLQWQQLQQQMLLQQQQRIAEMQQRRESLAERRERRYDQIREKAAQARECFDPEQQAERHLAAALRSEADGDSNAAVAYYRLVLATVPGSPSAHAASAALARLQKH